MLLQDLNCFDTFLYSNKLGELRLAVYDSATGEYIDKFGESVDKEKAHGDFVSQQEFYKYIRNIYLFFKYEEGWTIQEVADFLGLRFDTLRMYLQKKYAIRADALRFVFVVFCELKIFKYYNEKDK